MICNGLRGNYHSPAVLFYRMHSTKIGTNFNKIQTCAVMKTEKCIDVQDHYDATTPMHFTSLVECITNECGVWKGTCDSTLDKSAVCTTKGDGKYKGLQLYTNTDLKTYTMKYRGIKLKNNRDS
jgi:hypothetical protein